MPRHCHVNCCTNSKHLKILCKVESRIIGSVCGHRGQCSADGKGARVDGHGFGGVVGLVDADKAVGQLEHVVAQADDHELRVLGALLYVVRHDAHVLEVCTQVHKNIGVGLDVHRTASMHTNSLWSRVPATC